MFLWSLEVGQYLTTNGGFLGFHTMGGDEAMDKFEICMGANLTCMNDLMNRMGERKAGE